MFAGTIFKANVTMAIVAGKRVFLTIDSQRTYCCSRYDHIRPKTKPSATIQPYPLSCNQNFPKPTPTVTLTTNVSPVATATGTHRNERVQIIDKCEYDTVPMSYASVCRLNNDVSESSIVIDQSSSSNRSFMDQALCPYAEKDGICQALETGQHCPYIHGDLCDLCEMPVLHPTNEEQREQHRAVCAIIVNDMLDR
jgi:hypothetical protein